MSRRRPDPDPDLTLGLRLLLGALIALTAATVVAALAPAVAGLIDSAGIIRGCG